MKRGGLSSRSQAKPKGEPKLAPTPRPAEPWSTDDDLYEAKIIVRQRSRGVCEREGCTKPASNVHHKAGRGFAGCHHPDLLIDLCGNGNIDGCHGDAHKLPAAQARDAGLRLPWGTRAT